MFTPIILFAVAAFAPSVDMEREIECLIENIVQEAPSEPYEGKLGVATVVMNRVDSKYYPNTICEVVYQKWQFSWTMDKNIRQYPSIIYNRAREIAEDVVYRKKRLASIGKAMYFHNGTVYPKWAPTMRMIRKIGGHFFYTTG